MTAWIVVLPIGDLMYPSFKELHLLVNLHVILYSYVNLVHFKRVSVVRPAHSLVVMCTASTAALYKI